MNWAKCRRCGAEYDYELCANEADLCWSCLMSADRFIQEQNAAIQAAQTQAAEKERKNVTTRNSR